MLDERLRTAVRLYDRCALAADIGTDHAFLPSALLREGICDRMILTDLSESALANARKEIQRRGLTDRVELRCGDGLAPLREKCDMISILGMGGRTVADILLEGRDRLRGASLLLSSHTDLDRVRRAVMEIGYRLTAETPCLDAGRYYLLMKAVPGAETLSALQLRTGARLESSDSPVLLPWMAHRLEVLEAKRRGLERAETPDEAELARVREDAAYYTDFLKNAALRAPGTADPLKER